MPRLPKPWRWFRLTRHSAHRPCGRHSPIASRPRTLHDLTCERAFAQWSSSMWAGILQRIDLAVYVEERHADPSRLDGQASPWLEIRDFGDSDTPGHRPLSLGVTDRYRALA